MERQLVARVKKNLVFRLIKTNLTLFPLVEKGLLVRTTINAEWSGTQFQKKN